MKVLVLFDSYFGNTEQVAHAIAGAFPGQEDVRVAKVREFDAQQLEGLDCLVVGSPTRAFRPSDGMNEFLRTLAAHSLDGVKVAAFDTRISVEDIQNSLGRVLVNLAGYAAKPIAKKLQKAGGELMMAPEGFYVKGEKGPMKEGELERAAQWGRVCSSS